MGNTFIDFCENVYWFTNESLFSHHERRKSMREEVLQGKVPQSHCGADDKGQAQSQKTKGT